MLKPVIRRPRGVVLLVLLLALAIMGVIAVETTRIGEIALRRHAERQLMVIGLAYRRAIAAYAAATPSGASPYPKAISDLLHDPRYPDTHRYLRDAYPDPMTHDGVWGFVSAPGGGFAGVFSRSTARPIKLSGFPDDVKFFEDAQTYQDWIFTSLDPNVVRQALGRTSAVTGIATTGVSDQTPNVDHSGQAGGELNPQDAL